MKLVDLLENNKILVQKVVDFQELPLCIEKLPGSVEITQMDDGSVRMRDFHCSYGYIKGINGCDNEPLDIYLNNNPNNDSKIYIIHQLKYPGDNYDEDKVMLGFNSMPEAISCWSKHLHDPITQLGGCSAYTMDDFKDILSKIPYLSESGKKIIICREHTFDNLKDNKLIDNSYNHTDNLKESKSPQSSFKLKPNQINDYLEAAFSLPFMTHHKMSKNAKKLFNKNFKKKN